MAERKAGKRLISFERLRLLAMFMVLLLHFTYQSGALAVPGSPMTPTRLLGGLVESFSVVAVNVYVLISGYFLCEASFRLERLLQLIGQILFYTLLIPCILAAAGIPVYGTDVWKAAVYFLPVSMNHYWFATAYVMMFLFSPILNVAIHRLSARALRLCVGLLLFFFCLLPSLSPVQLVTDQAGYDFGWFLVLYLTAGYIRRYGIAWLDGVSGADAADRQRTGDRHSYLRAGLCYGISCFLIYALHVGLQLVNERTGGLQYYATVPFHYNTVLCLLGAIGLFDLFRLGSLRERNKAHVSGPEEECEAHRADRKGKKHKTHAESVTDRMVRWLAPLTFGVYLIHQHVDIKDRWYGWLSAWCGFVSQDAPLGYLARAVLETLLLYLICLAIDAVRRWLFRLLGRALGGTVLARWCRRADAFFQSM